MPLRSKQGFLEGLFRVTPTSGLNSGFIGVERGVYTISASIP